MRIAEILHRKGSKVFTIRSVKSVADAVQKISELRIGALVVVDRWGKFVGMLSEREILYALAQHGGKALSIRVEDAMHPDVTTCSPGDRVDKVMAMMTTHRVRHLPVMDGTRIVGVVSIGDLVKHQLEEKTQEARVLRDMNALRESPSVDPESLPDALS